MRDARTQGYIVNRPQAGGFGCITFDYMPDGVQVTFVAVKPQGHVEDRVNDDGMLILGYASILLRESAGAALRVVA